MIEQLHAKYAELKAKCEALAHELHEEVTEEFAAAVQERDSFFKTHFVGTGNPLPPEDVATAEPMPEVAEPEPIAPTVEPVAEAALEATAPEA